MGRDQDHELPPDVSGRARRWKQPVGAILPDGQVIHYGASAQSVENWVAPLARRDHPELILPESRLPPWLLTFHNETKSQPAGQFPASVCEPSEDRIRTALTDLRRGDAASGD